MYAYFRSKLEVGGGEKYIDEKHIGATEKELQQRLMGRNHGSGVGDPADKGPRPVNSRKMEGAGE